MAKRLNGRFIQKHDIEANWLKATGFVPLLGETIVYDPDETYDYARLKVGDGVRNVNDLPFANIQPDWSQDDDDAADYIKNKPIEETEDAAMEMLAEMGILDPVTDEENNIFTDENGDVFTV